MEKEFGEKTDGKWKKMDFIEPYLCIYLSRVLRKAFLHYRVFQESVCKCRCLHFLDYSPFTLECKPSYTHHRQASVASGKGHSQHSSRCRLILQESPVFMNSSSDRL